MSVATTGEPDAELQRLLDGMVGDGLVSAAVAVVGTAERVERHAAAGRTRRAGGRAVRVGDRFDLASLTKPFTATLALALDERGLLPLGARLGDVWGERAAGRLALRSLESLLRHRSGLKAWEPLYSRSRTRAGAIGHLLSRAAQTTCLERYGDLGYILWGASAEQALGVGHEKLLRRYLLGPLGMRATGAAPGALSSVVECPLGNDREVALAAELGIVLDPVDAPEVGAVQDGNARFLGGLAGHAGLFGSAADLWRLASEWLAPRRVLSGSAVGGALTGGRLYTLGWRRRTLRGSGGPALSPPSFGHVGFTGGSLWVEPRRDTIMVLLAHRTSVAVDLKPWRRRFHRVVLDSPTPRASRKGAK